ncbi:MAG: Rieske 2Fe-2S domain-containing protein [Novosphingobium sp.]
MSEPVFTPAAPLADVPSGTVREISLGGRSILLCYDADGLYAVENKCSHADMPLACGRMRNGWIMCPTHGARFDLATGQPLGPPAPWPIATFAVRVVDGMIEVAA